MPSHAARAKLSSDALLNRCVELENQLAAEKYLSDLRRQWIEEVETACSKHRDSVPLSALPKPFSHRFPQE